MTFLLSNSSFIKPKAPSSVVQTGVKSLGCEKITPQLSPNHSWKEISPSVVLAKTTEGDISFHEWLGDSWGVIFSHPKDFTPVCTTELGALGLMKDEFDKRNVKVIGLSVDGVEDHKKWLDDIKDVSGTKPNYPIIADEDLKVAKLFNMLEADAGTTSMGRTAVDNETVRTIFVIRPDKRIGLYLTYPMATGRNFLEILRAIDSMQLHRVYCTQNL